MRPEQIKVLATYADGGVAVIAFVTVSYRPDGEIHWEREASPENIEAECAKISQVLPSPIVSWRVIADADVPTARDYRNAWIDTGNAVGHDMPRARELHRDKLRRAREREELVQELREPRPSPFDRFSAWNAPDTARGPPSSARGPPPAARGPLSAHHVAFARMRHSTAVARFGPR